MTSSNGHSKVVLSSSSAINSKTSTTVDTPLTSVRQQMSETAVECQLGTELEVGGAGLLSFPTVTSTSTQPTTASTSRTTAFTYELLLCQNLECFRLNGP